ncbi:MAG: hypothetical protein LRY39_01920 [Alphaproteobacteria bacterium]|nr:hypothetical protein [Alphaproteobacteria bacterium]
MNTATSTAPPAHSHYAGSDDMRGSVITSSLFHIFIFIVLSVGLPFLPKDPIEISQPVNVEIVDVSDISRTNNPAPPAA